MIFNAICVNIAMSASKMTISDKYNEKRDIVAKKLLSDKRLSLSKWPVINTMTQYCVSNNGESEILQWQLKAIISNDGGYAMKWKKANDESSQWLMINSNVMTKKKCNQY